MLALFALLGLFDTFGDAHSYTRTSADGRYVLVMLVPGSAESEMSGQNAGATKGVAAIRSTYEASGLYRVEDSTLIWSMPEFESDAVVASDGEHVVGYQSYIFGSTDEILRFHVRGKLLKRYRRLDLGFLLLCRRSTSTAFCIEDVRLLETKDRVRVRPYIGFPIEFDLEGNLIWSSPAPAFAISTGSIALGLLSWFVWKRLIKAREDLRTIQRL